MKRAMELLLVIAGAAGAGCEGKAPYDPQNERSGLTGDEPPPENFPPGTTLQQDDRRYRTEREEDQAAVGHQGGNQGTDDAQRGDPERAAVVGDTLTARRVQGVVREVDPSRGRVSLDVQGDVLDLRALPSDLLGLRPGQGATFDYGTFGGEDWIVARAESGPALARRYGTAGSVSGQVDGLDPDEGTFEVGGTQYHAHPSQLRGMVTGQSVSLTYANVDGMRWVSSLKAQTDGAQPQVAPVTPGSPPPASPPEPGKAEPGLTPDHGM